MRILSLVLSLCLALILPIGAGAQMSTTFDGDIAVYADICTQEVGAVPSFSCASGAEVPITVNGETPDKYTRDLKCDRPALLDNGAESDGQCVPYSRIVDLSYDGLQISAMCRQKTIRAKDALVFDEIDIIAHKPSTGATCWFQAKGTVDKPINGEMVPSPQDAEHLSMWETPSAVIKDGCGACHDNDPFMYSPFVGQVWDSVPSNPFGYYYHIANEMGFDKWPLKTFDMRDNTCTGCHRIGSDQSCDLLTDYMTGDHIPTGADKSAANFPGSHTMPPDHNLTLEAWLVTHEKSVREVKHCCANPDDPVCVITPIERRED